MLNINKEIQQACFIEREEIFTINKLKQHFLIYANAQRN